MTPMQSLCCLTTTFILGTQILSCHGIQLGRTLDSAAFVGTPGTHLAASHGFMAGSMAKKSSLSLRPLFQAASQRKSELSLRMQQRPSQDVSSRVGEKIAQPYQDFRSFVAEWTEKLRPAAPAQSKEGDSANPLASLLLCAPLLAAVIFGGASMAMAADSGAAEAVKAFCEEPYGYLPCSTAAGPNVFLMATYGFLLFQAAKFISEGSELLLEVLDPGIVGGLFLPVLGAFADAMIIIAAGGGPIERVQEEVSVGLGVLAGSTVMLLTIAWGGSLFAGRCDLTEEGASASGERVAINRKLSEERKSSLTETGVTTDAQTRVGAWIMAISCLPYLIIQVPLIDGHTSEGPEAALIGTIVCAVGFVGYSVYQVAFPWLQNKRIEDARFRLIKARAVDKVFKSALQFGGLVQSDGTVNVERLEQVFESFDRDNNQQLCDNEVEGLIVGLATERGSLASKDEIATWMNEFDADENGFISKQEFITGMQKWIKSTQKQSMVSAVKDMPGLLPSQISDTANFLESVDSQEVEEELEEGEGGEMEELSTAQIYQRAAFFLAIGTGMVTIFADPMVGSVNEFAKSTGISAFFVAFVVTPFASNASEVVSSFIFAAKKRQRTISLTYSQIYGAVTINNTLCLGLFLGLVWSRGLTWDFSAEVTATVVTVLGMALLTGTRTTFPTALAPPVLAVYPAAIAGIVAMEQILGWN